MLDCLFGIVMLVGWGTGKRLNILHDFMLIRAQFLKQLIKMPHALHKQYECVNTRFLLTHWILFCGPVLSVNL